MWLVRRSYHAFSWTAAVLLCSLAAHSSLAQSSSFGTDAGRIAWAATHCLEGAPSLAALLFIEAWRDHKDFEQGRQDAEEAGKADVPAACEVIRVLYGEQGLSVQGLWQVQPERIAVPRS